MNIMLVSDAWSPQINGVVITLGKTQEYLQQRGHRVQVIHPGLFRTIACPGYPEIRLAIAAGKKLAEQFDRFQADALHIATEGPLGIAAWRYAKKAGLPFTTAYHTRFPEYLHARMRLSPRISYYFLRRFHQAAVRTLVPSPGVRQDLIDHGFTPGKLVLWSRGVDTTVFSPTDPKEADRKPTPSGPVFLYAGRVAVEKNIDAFLRLDLPGEKWVTGDGPAREQLQKRYPNVRFTGAKTHQELADIYRQADVFVFPSQTDTFGLVLLEAMACGCPVAALPAVSTSYVLGDSGAGVIDQDLGKACLQALHINRDIPAHYARQFSWENTAQCFFDNLAPMTPRAAG